MNNVCVDNVDICTYLVHPYCVDTSSLEISFLTVDIGGITVYLISVDIYNVMQNIFDSRAAEVYYHWTCHGKHTYPQQFFKFQTWQMTVIYYKVHYLPGGVRIRFHPNCRVGVFGDMANLSSEIG